MNSSRAYIPVHAFGSIDVKSLLNIVLAPVDDVASQKRYDYHHSRRTMLYYLLSIRETEKNEQLMNLIADVQPKLNWELVEKNYQHFRNIVEPYQKQYRAENLGTYWEKKLSYYLPGASHSLQYISRHRQDGFLPQELKLYWNYQQISQLSENDRFNPETDQDSHDNLNKYPVEERNNPGEVKFVNGGIEKAVFTVPPGKQVIVLDFADERMPGGYFLEDARTQEEVRFRSNGTALSSRLFRSFSSIRMDIKRC